MKRLLRRLLGTEFGWDSNSLSPRYGYSHPPLPALDARLRANLSSYSALLGQILDEFSSDLRRLPLVAEEDGGPAWSNKFLPPLDLIVLYGMLRRLEPSTYFEIGSGLSTLVARRAIQDGGRRTRIIAVDPVPRTDVASACDELMRQPFQSLDLQSLELRRRDVVFLDGSHRAQMDSDVTVFMLELLPNLPRGVHVQIHDVYLPNDYPPEWAERRYNEQYLLACHLISAPERYEVTFPGFFATHHLPPDPGQALVSWLHEAGLAIHGESFWLEIT